jgi:hydroxyacylglutathione hydrolase
MKVVIMPLNSDNFGYLIVDEDANECAIVDVSSQPEKVLAHIAEGGWRLTKVLTTHHHWDHAGGNNKLKEQFPELKIYGSATDKVEGCTDIVGDGDDIQVTPSISARCILTPGHTMGHVSYFVQHPSHNVIFTGDTMFLGGVGKFFEGSAAQMHENLYATFGGLPPATRFFPGHEYTASNLRFGAWVEPANAELRARLRAAEARHGGGGAPRATIGSALADERQINVFWRAHVPEVAAAAEEAAAAHLPPDEVAAARAAAGAAPFGDARAQKVVETIALLRALKDHGAHTKAGAKL